MNQSIPSASRHIIDALTGSGTKTAGVSRAAVKQLLRETDFEELLTRSLPTGRVSCREVLALCMPLLDRLCPEPEEGWLSYTYAELAHRLFPDKTRKPSTAQQRQALWIYCTLLSELFKREAESCPVDPLTDIPALEEQELAGSLIPQEYARFRQAVEAAFFVPLLRIGRELMPFDPASHTIGVHYMALHMARQAAQAGLPVDLALVSASALSHDIGKFGCRGEDASRIPYLHYYYTWDWLNRQGLPKIAHVAANHSTWDLEFENLQLESLLLIYADFRVRGTRENGREVMRIYSLAESYEMIFSKLYNMTPEKQKRYETVYRKLSDFEQYLRSYGVQPEPLSQGLQRVSRPDAALLTPAQTLPALCNLTFDNNIRLMYTITKDVTFLKLLDQARGEKNLHRIRTYLRLFGEYNTYMTGQNKRRTLNLLYELLMHHQGDVRRVSAEIMGQILANSGPKYRKELPSGAPHSAMAPATAAFLTESVELWESYIESCLHPDHKISAKHALRISNSLKVIAMSLFASCDAHEQPHYLQPLLNRLFTAQGHDRFVLTDALYYLPLVELSKEQLDELLSCFVQMLADADEPLQLVILRRLELLLPKLGNDTDRAKQCLSALPEQESCAVRYLHERLARRLGMASKDDTALPVSQLYLSNLKNAVHWMVKLTQVDALCEDAVKHPASAMHTATHLTNLLSVSEHLPVRNRAGAGLLRIFGELTVDQQNEIVVDLLRELETGQDEISTFIPQYLGALLAQLPEKELEECLDFLEQHVRGSNVRSASASLMTLGRLLTVLSATDRPVKTERIFGLLLTGVAHYSDAIHQSALTVLCEEVLAGPALPEKVKRQYFLTTAKKLLTLLNEPRPGQLNSFTQAAVLNHLYRFLTDSRVNSGELTFPEPKPVAFFPGTFDPFTSGHKRIVEEIEALGCEVYLSIDEFSWSKQPLPKLLRRQIASMSAADRLNVYLFPDELPINIASAEDLSALREVFQGRKLYLVAGSDVLRNASAYKNPQKGGAADCNHIIFTRVEEGEESLATLTDGIRGEVKLLTLPAFYETVSSTRIREYVDKNMDISMLTDPMVQNFIYERGLYLRSPQFKNVLQERNIRLRLTRQDTSLSVTLSGEQSGLATGHTVRSTELYAVLGDMHSAEFLRRQTSGRILQVDEVRLEGEDEPELLRLLLTELLVRSLEDDHTYALYHAKQDDALKELLPQLGFLTVPAQEDVYYVDMRTPVVLIQDVLLRFKEPHRSDSELHKAVAGTRLNLRLALARLFAGKLIAAFDAEQLNQSLMERVEELNGVRNAPPKTLGKSMCVPYGKILAGEVVPHTVTKSLHVDKAYTDDIYHFIIKEYPGYSNLINQARTIRSFHRPVILVDDLLHKGYRLEKLDAIFKQESLHISKIIVGILSGRGKDLMQVQNREVECEYFIPNLLYWFTESLLYPFIGGDSLENSLAPGGLLATENLVLPYAYPGYIRNVREEDLQQLSMTVLENAQVLMKTVESRHQQLFGTALTVRRLAEAFIYPRVPYRGRYMNYDLDVPASAYILDDIATFRRLQK